jgi:hypothetical protein
MATAQQGSSPQQPITSDPASNPDQELGRRDQDGDGKADFIQRYADDFKAPYGHSSCALIFIAGRGSDGRHQ